VARFLVLILFIPVLFILFAIDPAWAAPDCKIKRGGINVIMGSIAGCIKDDTSPCKEGEEKDENGKCRKKCKKDEERDQNGKCQEKCKKDEERDKDGKCKKKCKKDEEKDKDGKCQKKCEEGEKRGEDGQCRKCYDACRKNPVGEACMRQRLGGAEETCEWEPDDQPFVPDNLGDGGGPETDEGGIRTDGTGTENGDKDEGGGEESEDLDGLARQCKETARKLTGKARDTPKDITKATICKQITENAAQCFRTLKGHDDVLKAHKLRYGTNSLSETSGWACYCMYSLRAMDRRVERASDDPFDRFGFVKERIQRSIECQRYWMSGALDERYGPRPGGDGGKRFRKNPFGTETLTSATGQSKVLKEQCRLISDQLHDYIGRSFGESLKEDYIRYLVGEATWCEKQWLSGVFDKQLAPDIARDPYKIGKFCKERPDLPGCQGR